MPAINSGRRGLSAAFAPVNRSLTGWPSGFTAAWSFEPNPPQPRPNASADWPPLPSAFFDAGGARMGEDAAAVDEKPFGVVVAQLGRDPLPDAAFAPAVVSLPQPVRLADARGQVGPSDTGLGQVTDDVYEQPGVVADAVVPAGLARKHRLNAVPVIVGQVVAAEHGGLGTGKWLFPLSQPAYVQSTRPNHFIWKQADQVR